MAHILTVEDDPRIRQLVALVLEADGHEVDEAESGAEALERLSARPYDLVVLDLMLGRISGWQVMRQIEHWGLRSKVKVLILTARASERDILHGWRMGADAYMAKPFDSARLVEAINETLRRSPEDLAARREEELRKAELLYRVQVVFGEPALGTPGS